MSNLELVLASASPRRSELLRVLGLPFTVAVSTIDEDTLTATYQGSPQGLALWLAEQKAHDVATAGLTGHRLILAADTTVILQGRQLGKPAIVMLRELRGQQHEVVTGVVLLDTRTGQAYRAQASTSVTMRRYGDDEIGAYVASGDPLDKAGAYAIQHPEFRPVACIAGCYLNVIGLPLCLVALLLHCAGIAVPPGRGVGLCGWSLHCTSPLPEALQHCGKTTFHHR
jgi:septum formation protein